MVIYKGDHTKDIMRIVIYLKPRGWISGTPADIERAYMCFSREVFGINWKVLFGDVMEKFAEWLDNRDIPDTAK